MVRAASITHGERSHAQILTWLHPGFKDGSDGFVFLKVHAANLTGAVVYVEVRGNFCLLGLHRDLSGFTAQQSRHAFHGGIVHGRTGAKAVWQITPASPQPFFFSSTQAGAV